jgi:hypothetical protein
MRVIFASFSVWFAEMITPVYPTMGAEAARDHMSALPDDRTGLDDQRHVRGWICEQPDALQWIAVQHDHIRTSTGRKGLELALGAQQLRRHARRRAEFRTRAHV